MAATIENAWADGYDAVIVDNFTVAKGRKGSVLIVKDPAQLRVPWAKFDPTKRNSSNLLSGFAGTGLLGSTIRPLNSSPKQEAD
jgi:hypothetical protein